MKCFRQSILFRLTLTSLFLFSICAGVQAQEKEKNNPIGKRAQRVELEPVTAGLDDPVSAAAAPGDDKHLYVVQSGSKVVAVSLSDKSAPAVTFLDFSVAEEERSAAKLAGIVFHPQFETNGKFYLSYWQKRPKVGGLTWTLSEFIASSDRTVSDISSEKSLISLNTTIETDAGGSVSFGPDRMLYLGIGDGGGKSDPKSHGQNLDTMFAAVLRIDIDQGDPYLPPLDNPFVVKGSGLREVWAHGFHDPHALSFDSKTGDLWVVDRGQDTFEEVNVVVRAGNYGWSVYEGTQCLRMRFECLNNSLKAPLITYDRSQGKQIVGGYVYRGSKFPSLQGLYIYGDGSSGRIWAAKQTAGKLESNQEILKTTKKIRAFVVDNSGELYVLTAGPGELFHLVVPVST